ncbi:MAG: outer membrane protein assembly factor BamD [Calditrichaeota bacterium]|nr:MAG: outer membrane protein assembly factor BamD [Calditrichota bacterium]
MKSKRTKIAAFTGIFILAGFSLFWSAGARALAQGNSTDGKSDIRRHPEWQKRMLPEVTISGQPAVLAAAQDRNLGRLQTAQSLERRGNYPAALQIYRSLYEQVPNNLLYYEGVKRNLMRLKRFDELLPIITEQLRRTRDERYEADLGNAFYKRGDRERGMSVWKKMLQDHPKSQAVYSYVAAAMLDNRLYEDAAAVYKLARERFKRDDLFVFELANIYVIRLQYEKATLEFLRHLERNPNQFNYIEGRIAGYTKEPESAGKVATVLQAYLKQSKHPDLVRKLLADLYLRSEDYDRALQEFSLLEKSKKASNKNAATAGRDIYFFAEKSLHAGRYDYANRAFDLVIANYADTPYLVRALYGKALALQLQGQAREALAAYDQFLQAYPNHPLAQDALFQIGEINFQEGVDLDEALRAYDRILKRWPRGRHTLRAHFRIGDCYAARGDFQRARTWYSRAKGSALATPAAKEEALYKLAYLDFVQGEYDLALEKLNQVTADLTSAPVEGSYVNDALELIFLIEENKNDAEDALKLYSEAQKLKLERKTADAIKTLQQVVSRYPAAAILDECLMDLGELESQRGNHLAAIGYFRGVVEEHPESVYASLAQKRIGDIYETGLGDTQKAVQAYEKVLVEYPNSTYLEEVRQNLRRLQSAQKLSN